MAGPDQACDIANLFEGTFAKYDSPQYSPGPWWGNYPANRVAHVIHRCPEANLCRAAFLSRGRGVGHVYIYDGGGTNPSRTDYDHLTTYWKKEVAVVALRDDDDVYVRD